MEPSGLSPTIIALVVCDNIYREPGGKTALVGLFSSIATSQFPAVHPRLAVFLSVTSVRPGMTGRLEIVHGETDVPVITATGAFPEVVSPTTVIDMNFILKNVTFPEPATYFIRFFGNDIILVQRPFEVRQIVKKEAP